MPDAIQTPANVPATVTVVFPRSDDGVVSGTYSESVLLADLALPEYRGCFGRGTEQLLRYDTLALFDASGAATNAADITALATRAATDFYLWRLASCEILYEGEVAWQPDGLHDVEWMHGATRVHVSEWFPLVGTLKYAPTCQDDQTAVDQIFTDTNDWEPTSGKTSFRIPVSGTRYFTGIDASCCGKLVEITNAGTGTLIMPSLSTSSASANRLKIPGNVTVSLLADEVAAFRYDCTSNVWRLAYTTSCFCGTPGGSGGSGPATVHCAECQGGIACPQMSFNLAGITDGPDCTDCDTNLNGDYLLNFVGSCAWSLVYDVGNVRAVCGDGLSVDIYADSPDVWVLAFTLTSTGTVIAQYRFAGSWNCQSAILFKKQTSDNDKCLTWPSGITVSPYNCGTTGGAGCIGCPTICDPLTLDLTGAGIADGTCTDCNENLNTSFSLLNTGDCTWTASATVVLCAGTALWVAVYDRVAGLMTLTLADQDDNIVVKYEKTLPAWDCLADVTGMTKVEDGGQCTAWPDTVDLTCAASPACADCDPVEFTISGVTNEQCSPTKCDPINNSFSLPYTGSNTWTQAAPFAICGYPAGGQNCTWFLFQTGGVWYLELRNQIASPNDIVARYAVEQSWDCTTPLELSHVVDNNSCQNWPGTITISCGGSAGSCTGCAAVNAQFTFTITGATAGTCSGCTALNGVLQTVTFDPDAIICSWPGPNFVFCGSAGHWILTYSGGTVQLAHTSTGDLTYSKVVAWNCQDAVTLDVGAGGACNTLPLTLTMTPV